ncbi:MAG: hypothetical protein AAFO95_13695, partial [Cyanobacteria bacterium J06600_6]
VQNEKMLYQKLQQSDTTVVSVGHRPSMLRYHQQVLQLTGQSQWQVSSIEDYLVTLKEDV